MKFHTNSFLPAIVTALLAASCSTEDLPGAVDDPSASGSGGAAGASSGGQPGSPGGGAANTAGLAGSGGNMSTPGGAGDATQAGSGATAGAADVAGAAGAADVPGAAGAADVAGAAGAADVAGAAGADDDVAGAAGADDDVADDDVADDDVADDDDLGMMADDDGPSGDECVVGSTQGNEVVFIGESFIAASSIAQETTNLARANGSLQQSESYLNASVSGTRMGDGAIPRQYTQTAAGNPIRFVLMNGGGNDCLQANDPNAPIPAAEQLYAEMAADGVEKVVYFFYPDAAGSFGGPTSSLQTCLNEYRPKIKALCESLTAPKCYWLDLAETDWSGNEDAYTSDGIHPNAQGSQVTAEAIWSVMVENCVAQ